MSPESQLRFVMKSRVKRILKKALRRLAPSTAKDWDSYKYVKQEVLPKELNKKDPSNRIPIHFLGNTGIEMHTTEQLERLERWNNDPYLSIFNGLRDDPQINTQCLHQNYIYNRWFSTPDAEIYAAMILDFQPLQIIEIGSGFSTLIAKKTVGGLGNHCKIIAIDPQPRTDIQGFADSIIYKYVEDVHLSDLPIEEKTLVFIDSSHIIRSGGDIPYLYNQLLPSLPSGIICHVHDIFIPYDYPFVDQHLLYTEQYILHALLTYSSRYKVIFATHYMIRQHADAMQKVFGDKIGKDDLYYGPSFWFQIL
jgi:hypothetical protein